MKALDKFHWKLPVKLNFNYLFASTHFGNFKNFLLNRKKEKNIHTVLFLRDKGLFPILLHKKNIPLAICYLRIYLKILKDMYVYFSIFFCENFVNVFCVYMYIMENRIMKSTSRRLLQYFICFFSHKRVERRNTLINKKIWYF